MNTAVWKQWKGYRYVLVRRVFLTLLTGAAGAVVGLAGFLAAGDRILLGLSVAVCLCSLWKGILLWGVIKGGGYETVEGVCVGVTSPPFRRYKKIRIIDGNGMEGSLLLHSQARIRIGYRYRFFFKKGGGNYFKGEYLSAMLETGLFLGHEEMGEYLGTDEDHTG
jgi:hypothetical protein